MATAIETTNLSKSYGKARGIVEVSLEVRVGEVFGFLGPNGAGKSTTIRTLMNFLQPSHGSAKILGLDIRSDSLKIRQRTGYLPGDLALYDSMTARECLLYFANLRKLDLAQQIKTLAERFELDLDRKIGDYSTGNRQKVGLVNAFMHDPELLILDEPTSGLDPLIQQEFHNLVEEVRAEGRTVFLSSHILPEVDRVADRVGIIRDGRLIAVDTVEAFKAKAHASISIQFSEPVDPEVFSSIDTIVSMQARSENHVLTMRYSGSIDPLLKKASEYSVVSLSAKEGELEEAFLAYYAGGQDAP